MRILMLAAVLCLTAGPAGAEPIVLKCRTTDGTSMVDLTIDLDNGKFEWGLPYTVTHSDDQYISAYQKFGDVGGEIFVINRVTGEFKRASVGIFYSADNIGADGLPKSPGKLGTHIYTGRCGPKLF